MAAEAQPRPFGRESVEKDERGHCRWQKPIPEGQVGHVIGKHGKTLGRLSMILGVERIDLRPTGVLIVETENEESMAEVQREVLGEILNERLDIPHYAMDYVVKKMETITEQTGVKLELEPGGGFLYLDTTERGPASAAWRKLQSKLTVALERQSRQKHSNQPTRGRPDSHQWSAQEIHKLPKKYVPRRVPGTTSRSCKCNQRAKRAIDKQKEHEKRMRQRIPQI